MSYVRSKIINGCGPYYYEVRCVRNSSKPYPIQEHIRYIGTSPGTRSSTPSNGVVPKSEDRPKGYLDVGDESERTMPKTWDRQRRERAKVIAESTKSSYFQADALAKTAWRMGLDPSKVDWDQLQGKDMEYDEKVSRLGEMSGQSTKTDKEYEMAGEQYLEDQAERESFRTGAFAGAEI